MGFRRVGDSKAAKSPEQALERELAEETGLDRLSTSGPCVWVRDHWFGGMAGWGGQSERIYLVAGPAHSSQSRRST